MLFSLLHVVLLRKDNNNNNLNNNNNNNKDNQQCAYSEMIFKNAFNFSRENNIKKYS